MGFPVNTSRIPEVNSSSYYQSLQKSDFTQTFASNTLQCYNPSARLQRLQRVKAYVLKNPPPTMAFTKTFLRSRSYKAPVITPTPSGAPSITKDVIFQAKYFSEAPIHALKTIETVQQSGVIKRGFQGGI